eukprot:COSAG06_NODE_19367_length_841_cov_5.830189_1_plen_112_part_10
MRQCGPNQSHDVVKTDLPKIQIQMASAAASHSRVANEQNRGAQLVTPTRSLDILTAADDGFGQKFMRVAPVSSPLQLTELDLQHGKVAEKCTRTVWVRPRAARRSTNVCWTL